MTNAPLSAAGTPETPTCVCKTGFEDGKRKREIPSGYHDSKTAYAALFNRTLS
jgi:hypothetical protein